MKENMPQEMSAQKLFEKLGYKLDKSLGPNYIDYWKNEETKYIVFAKRICFDLKKQTYFVAYSFETIGIDMSTNKAIQKQIEELGWLEE